jgi:crotonobetainyl-CoA:carnitine CoA-transferase CaiB-like acyl-CoA transferase
MLLEGIRVIDMTRAWAGPLAGRFLGDLGADVIHVEYPAARAGHVGLSGSRMERDPAWKWGELPAPHLRAGMFPDADPGERPWNRSGHFNKQHRNKRSLCLDLHRPGAPAVFHRLVAVSDVLLDNYSPAGARGLGTTYDVLKEINPSIIVVSLSGYGHTGPQNERAALGPMLEAQSGLASLTGYPGGPPMKLGAAFSDAVGGLNGAIAVLGALLERAENGTGCFMDVSQFEAYASFAGEWLLNASVLGEPETRVGNRSEAWCPQGSFPCAGDDEWLALTVRTDAEWRGLVACVGHPELRAARFDDVTARFADEDLIRSRIAEWTRSRPKHAASLELQSRGVPAMPVMTSEDLLNDPQLKSRGFFVEWDHPDVGTRTYPGFPIHFDPDYHLPMVATATLGQHNEEILSDLLGYSPAEIDELEQSGAIRTSP